MKTSEILLEAKKAKGTLGVLSTEDKNRALMAMADALIEGSDEILAANREDVENAREHISSVMLDRLILNRERIAAMAEGTAVSRHWRIRWDVFSPRRQDQTDLSLKRLQSRSVLWQSFMKADRM